MSNHLASHPVLALVEDIAEIAADIVEPEADMVELVADIVADIAAADTDIVELVRWDDLRSRPTFRL